MSNQPRASIGSGAESIISFGAGGRTDSIRFAVWDSPEMMFDFSSRTWEKRDAKFAQAKMRSEDQNASADAAIGRVFDDLDLKNLMASRINGLENTPFRVYLYKRNFQLLKKVATHYNKEIHDNQENWTKEVHAMTSYRFNKDSPSFNPHNGTMFYIMIDEDVLIGSLIDCFDNFAPNVGGVDLKTIVDFMQLAIRSNLVNKFFVTKFLRKQLYLQALTMFISKRHFEMQENTLVDFAQILKILLERSVKYRTFAFNYRVATRDPISSRSRITSETKRTSYVDESVLSDEDAEAFEGFKNDSNFWSILLNKIIIIKSECLVSDIWSSGEAYVVFELLSLMVQHLDRSLFTQGIVQGLFDLINFAFDKLGAAAGKLPITPARDSGFSEEPDGAKLALENDRKLTMYLRVIKLALKIAGRFQSSWASGSEALDASVVLELFTEFVCRYRVAKLLYDSDLKGKPNLLYPYSDEASRKKKPSGLDGYDAAPPTTLNVRCHKMISEIYHFSFRHFYSDSIRRPISMEDFENETAKLIDGFKLRVQMWGCSEERLQQIFDVQSLSVEQNVRKFHLEVLRHFMHHGSDVVVSKLCKPSFSTVPLVKAVYYTTEFVLKRLNLDRDNSGADPDPSQALDDTYFKMPQSQIVLLDFDSLNKSQKCLDERSRGLYSYFFSINSGPERQNLLYLITFLLENFINTFLYGRPTNVEKHFYKVIAFERSSIDQTSTLIAPRWASSSQQSPNSKEFLDRIAYEKAIEFPLPTRTSSDGVDMECQREASRIWEQQCINYCVNVNNAPKFSCKFNPVDSNETMFQSQKEQRDGTIELHLSQDEQKLAFKLMAKKEPKNLKMQSEMVADNSVMMKSCSFHLKIMDRSVQLRIELENSGATQQQMDMSGGATPFPIIIEEPKVGKGGEGGGGQDLDSAASNLIYFCEGIKILMAKQPHLANRLSFVGAQSECETLCRKLGKRREVEDNIAKLLSQTKSFPLFCLPLEAHSRGAPPPLPPLPTSWPTFTPTNSPKDSLCDL